MNSQKVYKLPVKRNPVNWNTFSGLVAILLWSSTFAFARSLSEEIGSLTGGATAYLIGGGACLARLGFSGARSHLTKLPRAYLYGCGSLFVLYTAAVYLAVGLAHNREQLLEVALVNYLWPALTVACSLLLLGKKSSLWLIPGIGLALTGICLVMTQGTRLSWNSVLVQVRSNPAAYALALVAAISWALYSNLTRRWTRPEENGAVEFFIPAAGLALFGLSLLRAEAPHWTIRAMTEATALAGVTTSAYFLWDLSMRRGNLLFVATCSYFTPLLSTVVSSLYLGVAPGPKLWVGCLVLILGSVLTWRSVSDEG